MPYKTPWLKDKNAGIVKIRNAVGDTTTQTGNPVSVDNEFGLGEVDNLSVALNPVQNFNGYDSPWIGGAGKNKLSLIRNAGDTETKAGVVYTVNADGSIDAVGTSIASNSYWSIGTVLLKPGNYILNGCPIGGSSNSYFIAIRKDAYNGTLIGRDTGSGFEFELTEDTQAYVTLYCQSGTVADFTFYPMIRLASEPDATFAPYENICPIYPANGKNLWEYSAEEFTRYKAYAVSLPAGTYTVSAVVTSSDTDSTTCRIGFFNAGGTSISAVQIGRNSRKSVTVTLGRECASIYLYASDTANHSTGDTATYADMMIELGSSATSYQPYQGIMVEQTGKNLIDINNITQIQRCTFTGTPQDFTLTVTGTYCFYQIEIPCKANQPVTVRFEGSSTGDFHTVYISHPDSYTHRYTLYSLAETFAERSFTFTPTEDAFRMMFYVTGTGTTGEMHIKNLQAEYGSEATEYEPFISTSYPYTLGQSVYGGTVDLATGVLTVDRAYKTLKWSAFGSKTAIGNYTRGLSNLATAERAVYPPTEGKPQLCDKAPYKAAYNEGSNHFYVNATTINMFMPTDTDGDTDISFCYELATPFTYNLTPQQISLLTGINYISSSDDITLTVTLPGWTSLIDPSKIKHDIYDLDAGNTTGRNLAGEMLRDRVAVKEKLNMEFPPMVADDYYAMLNLIKDQFFDVQYYSPFTGGKRVATMYVGDREGEPYYDYDANDLGNNMWTNVKFNFIER